MGKNRVIKIIADLIAGMVAHKIILKHTNKPESVNHLESEIDNYRGTLTDYLTEFNWNIHDKENIKFEAKKSLSKELKKSHFSDVTFNTKESQELIEKTLNEIM